MKSDSPDEAPKMIVLSEGESLVLRDDTRVLLDIDVDGLIRTLNREACPDDDAE